MAGYPRNNLHEQLTMKNGSNSTAAHGSAGKSARQQAGLAREMSGIGQYMKPAFSYAREGSAKVPVTNNRRQPISVESAASSSTLVSVQAAPPRRAGVTAPSRPVAQNGNNQAPSRAAAPTTKGKERARRYEQIDDDDGDVSQQVDDSGFADTSLNAKRFRAGPLNANQQTTIADLQECLARERKTQDGILQTMMDAASAGDTAKVQRISSAVKAVKREIEVLESKILSCLQAPNRPNATSNERFGNASASGIGRLANVNHAAQRVDGAPATLAAGLDDYDSYFDDLEDDAIVPVKQVAAKSLPGRNGKTPLQVATSAQQSTSKPIVAKLPMPQAMRNNMAPTPKQPPVRTVAAAKEELESYKWSADVRKALRQRFKLQDFRPNQLKAINATLSGKDVFVLMPTGGGKSMCYQLPAVVTSGVTQGVTVVVSPLISLIVDQVTALINKGITAVTLNSNMDAESRNFSLTQLRAPEPTARLVYVTPEMVAKSEQFKDVLQKLYQRKRLARFVVDEAHCVSRWGHDLRPDYKDLSWCKRTYPDIPIMALTATANERVKADIKDILGLGRDCVTLSQSFNRSNLYYEIRKKGAQCLTDLAAFIQNEHTNDCGIIYCLSRRSCEETADRLRDRFGIAASHYHAAMEKGDRQRVQMAWLKGDVKVICATIAFGMGIDKPNVRFVVHYNIPSSLEGYYQETGRAGRDGLPSTCLLYFSYADLRTHERFIYESQVSAEQKQSQREILNKVLTYCLNISDCRRTQVLQYFGEHFRPEQCHLTCDNCVMNKNVVPNNVDVTERAKDIVALVQRMQEDGNLSLGYAVDVYYGSRAKKIAAAGHDQLPEAGKGSQMHKTDVERLFLMLLGERLLVEREKKNKMGFTNSYLAIPKGAAFNKKLNSLGKQPLIMSMSKTLPKSKEAAPPKVQKSAASLAKSKIVSMQVGKPVRSGEQTFVDDQDEDEEEIETIAGAEEEGGDGDTLGSKSTRSVDSSTGSRNNGRSRNRSTGYGDETDGTYNESDDEADSSEEEAEGDAPEESEEDDVEVVHGVKDESDAYDSDIELVPAQAAAPTPKAKPKAKTAQDRANSKGSTEVSDIQEHYTRHIFFSLQEIAQEAAQTQEIEYDVKFDDVLLRIAAKRCQSKHSQRLLREKRVPSLTVCVAEFEDFAKIKGWDEEMYDQFGKAFKAAIARETARERRMISEAEGKNGPTQSGTSKKQAQEKSKKKVISISSTSASKNGGDGTFSKFFAKNEPKSATKAALKKVPKKPTSRMLAADLREEFTSRDTKSRSVRR